MGGSRSRKDHGDSGVDRRELAEAVITTYMVLQCNVHLWQHSESCFKKSKRTRQLNNAACRYLFPRAHAATTRIDAASMTLTPRRDLGLQYIDAYSDTIMMVLPTNHDVRLLADPNDMYYALKYTLKDQQQITNSAVLVKAFKRRVECDAQKLPADTQTIARRRVCSLVHAVTKKQEIAAPLAVHYLSGGDGCFVSDKFAPLLLGQAIAVFKNDEYECVVDTKGNRVIVSSSTDD